MSNQTLNNTHLSLNLTSDLGPIVDPSFLVMISFGYGMTCVVGSVGNFLLCYVVYKKRHARRTIHLLTLNLAVSDLMVLMLYLPVQLYQINSDMTWKLGEIACKTTYSLNALSVNANIMTLVAITRDRYTAVMDPLTAHSRATSTVRKFLLAIWLVSVVIMIPLLIVVDVYSHGDDNYCYEMWPNSIYERCYWIILFALQLVIPTIYFVFAYATIFSHLRSVQNLVKLTAQEDTKEQHLNIPKYSAKEEQRRQQQWNLIRLAVVLIVAYLVCVSPQHLVFFAYTFGGLGANDTLAVYVFVLSNFLLIFNSLLNPVIYASQSGEIKNLVCRLLRGCVERKFIGREKENLNKGKYSTTSILSVGNGCPF